MSTPKFSELPYVRPDLDDYKRQIDQIEVDFKAGSSAENHAAQIDTWNTLRKHAATMHSLAEVHFSQDVSNKKFKDEKHFFDEQSPLMMEWNTAIEKLIVSSPHRPELEKKYGALFFRRLEDSLLVFAPEVKVLMVQESELCTSYNEITASAKIELDGTIYNLSTIAKKSIDLDRGTRQRATKAQYEFIQSNGQEIDRIYNELVKLRTKKAKALGFKSYTEFRYVEFGRVDYDSSKVEIFRKQVLDYVVPLVQKLKHAQAHRLGLDHVQLHDEKLQFKDGNPIAQGEHDFIVEAASKMYSELSPETNEFFSLMLDRDLMDLKSRDNKAVGGYCTSFVDYGIPFIFANFNQTTHDVEVLTHEAGHAFQSYRSRNLELLEYYWPTAESCEIHSMAMEFLTWPWMKDFFGDQTEKFKFYHLAGALQFLPYGCAVDQFQHWVYANPDASPSDRNNQWKELEALYLPWRDTSGVPAAEEGRQWQFQRHIIESPFYYIDYALAQTCALQYWQASLVDRDATFANYLKICDVGGSQSFLEIVKTGNLRSPFDPGCLSDIVDTAYSWLSEHYGDYLGNVNS